MAVNNTASSGWAGWIYFAGILMILRGVSQAFLGITGLVNKHYLFLTSTDSNQLVLTSAHIQAWGWIDLVVGLVIMAAGFSLLHGSTWARVLGILFMGGSFLVNMAYLSVFPLWSVVAMIVDVFVIYALVVHGREVE